MVWAKLGNSMGDLGTYIPIVLALSLVNGLNLGTILIFTALYATATGLLFGIPMPVQPMKSIAAVAISESSTPLSIPKITAAVLFLLDATGLMSFLYRFIPIPIVRRVELSQGLSFTFFAIKYIRYNQDFASSSPSPPSSSSLSSPAPAATKRTTINNSNSTSSLTTPPVALIAAVEGGRASLPQGSPPCY